MLFAEEPADLERDVLAALDELLGDGLISVTESALTEALA